MTHTPGPWSVVKHANFIHGADGSRVCDVQTDLRDRFNSDVALIAAAPTLLKCLEDMVAASNHSAAWERARAAIAQAKGEKE